MKKNTIAVLLAGLLLVGSAGTPVTVAAAEAGSDLPQEISLQAETDGEPDAGISPNESDNQGGTAQDDNTPADDADKDQDQTGDTQDDSDLTLDGEAGEETEEPAEELGISWNVKADGSVEIRFVDNVMYPDLRFAIWSKENGQDDLTWTPATATDSSNKEWVCRFDLAKLKSMGEVYIHAYTGATTCVGKLLLDIGQPSASAVTIKDLDVAAGTCTIEVSGLTHPELIRSMVIPTWSSAKQEDLVWYSATKKAGANLEDMVYEVKMSLANHKYNQGTYRVHVYMTDITGKQVFQVKTEVAFQAQGTVSAVATENATSFKAQIDDLAVPGGYNKLEFAVWTKENGQDDLTWVQTNSTSAIIDINDYKHLGEFIIHCYVTTKTGKMQYMGAASFTPSVGEPVIELGESTDGIHYPVYVKNVMVQNLKSITVPTWSEKNGQDDLKWYSAKKQSDGSYMATIDLRNHNTAGKYFIHVYAETTAGKMQFLGKNENLYVEEMNEGQTEVVISEVKPEQGTFVVTVKVPNSIDPITSVAVPVWCAADQSDIKWYSTKKLSNGDFQVTVNAANHKSHSGTYKIHVYGNYASGFSTCIAKTQQELKLEELTVTDSGKGKRTVVYRGSLDADSVSVPVWSTDNGQDDLVWYQASKNSSGYWQVTIDPANHKNAGLYLVHVYADGAFAANTTFTMEYDEVKTEYTELAKNLKVAQNNEQLILVAASGTTAQIVMLNKNTDGSWYQLLSTSGYVGSNGVGQTTEWNRRTPNGVFGFTQAFGIKADPGTVFDYVKVDSSYYWVDDVNSRYYNKFVTTKEIEADWSSAEHLIDYAGSYNYCLGIDYNPQCTPGVGSAIFLHCSAGRPTGGCVSVPESVMIKIMQNVRTDCKIVIDSKSGLAAY